MPNPTRQEIINAHNALEDLKNVALLAADFTSDTVLYTRWKKQILAALPPKPHPTMAEVEWDDEEHYLAEAEHPESGKVIMILQSAPTGNIYFIPQGGGEQHHVYSPPEILTPTGKRYTLTEVQDG